MYFPSLFIIDNNVLVIFRTLLEVEFNGGFFCFFFFFAVSDNCAHLFLMAVCF